MNKKQLSREYKRDLANVNNFARLIAICEAMGPEAYNPPRPELKLENLRRVHKLAQESVEEYHRSEIELEEAIAAREKAFGDFDDKIARSFKSLLASSPNILEKPKARELYDKFMSFPKVAAELGVAPPPLGETTPQDPPQPAA